MGTWIKNMIASALIAIVPAARAEIISSSPDHFTLKLEAETELSPDEVWARLIDPSSWWLPEHTYSGSSDNLSLKPHAGGIWREDWEGGSVWHGTVLLALPDQRLSLSAPFGPLQSLAVDSVWTISLTPLEDAGTR